MFCRHEKLELIENYVLWNMLNRNSWALSSGWSCITSPKDYSIQNNGFFQRPSEKIRPWGGPKLGSGGLICDITTQCSVHSKWSEYSWLQGRRQWWSVPVGSVGGSRIGSHGGLRQLPDAGHWLPVWEHLHQFSHSTGRRQGRQTQLEVSWDFETRLKKKPYLTALEYLICQI